MRLLSTSRLIASAGFALFVLALWGAHLSSETPPAGNQRALARLQVTYGEVRIERDGRRQLVQEATSFQRLETIETGPGSDAVLYFPNGDQVRLSESTVVFGDWEAGRPLLVVKSGDVWAERAGDPAQSAVISREGERQALASLRDRARKAPRPQRPHVPPSATKLVDRIVTEEKRQAPATLSASAIQDTLRMQRDLFFKCYGQLLQRTPGVSGEASVAFTIERSGRVGAAEISSSSLQDPQFRRCLTEAVKRVEFKSFAGEPIQTLFPIRFE